MRLNLSTKFFFFISQIFSFTAFAGLEDYSDQCFRNSYVSDQPYCLCFSRRDLSACDDPRAQPGYLASQPTRLSFATFASQNAYLATAQVVTDHLYKKRLSPDMQYKKLASYDDPRSKINSTTIMPTTCKKDGYFTGWLAPFGEYAHEKPQPDVAAFWLNVGGVTLGVDYNCAQDNVVGIAGSYVFTHIKEDADAGYANINQGFLDLYTNLRADKWYFDVALSGGYYHTDNARNNPFFTESIITTLSSTHGWQAAPHIEVGYDGYFSKACNVEWFGLEPFLLGDWVANWEHGFSEHGAPGLNAKVEGKFCSLLRTEAGLRFHESVKFNWGELVFQEKGSYAYQKMFNTGIVTASFIGSGVFRTRTLTSAQNLGVFEFSVFLKPSLRNVPYFDIRYQGEFGSRFQSHQGIVEMGKDF